MNIQLTLKAINKDHVRHCEGCRPYEYSLQDRMFQNICLGLLQHHEPDKLDHAQRVTLIIKRDECIVEMAYRMQGAEMDYEIHQ